MSAASKDVFFITRCQWRAPSHSNLLCDHFENYQPRKLQWRYIMESMYGDTHPDPSWEWWYYDDYSMLNNDNDRSIAWPWQRWNEEHYSSSGKWAGDTVFKNREICLWCRAMAIWLVSPIAWFSNRYSHMVQRIEPRRECFWTRWI